MPRVRRPSVRCKSTLQDTASLLLGAREMEGNKPALPMPPAAPPAPATPQPRPAALPLPPSFGGRPKPKASVSAGDRRGGERGAASVETSTPRSKAIAEGTPELRPARPNKLRLLGLTSPLLASAGCSAAGIEDALALKSLAATLLLRRGVLGVVASAATAAAALQALLAKPIVRRSLLGVAQHLVGMADLLELLGVAALVRVVLHRELAVGLLELGVIGGLLHLQGLVKTGGVHRLPTTPASPASTRHAARKTARETARETAAARHAATEEHGCKRGWKTYTLPKN
mmetsp:Transcript_114723/g.370914  ORF Transcript_114723/g.370914 Transcript_114723/m.370914 type:complete len:287 (-) Transcript_114723:8-868(-)